MDRYQMNRSYSRPYQSTCGRNEDSGPRQAAGRMEHRKERRMQRVESGNERCMARVNSGNERCMAGVDSAREENRGDEGCSCRLPGTESGRCMEDGMQNTAIGNLPLAMAYVPMQEGIGDTYQLDDALRLGTIFPGLCKPFCGCGKRGGSR